MKRRPKKTPCVLCKGIGAIYVVGVDESVVPAWCPCTRTGRELANGRTDEEVLRELAGDDLEATAP